MLITESEIEIKSPGNPGDWFRHIREEVAAAIPPESDPVRFVVTASASDEWRCELGIIDEIVTEPLGGAHRYPQEMADTISSLIERELARVEGLEIEELIGERLGDRLVRFGPFVQSDHGMTCIRIQLLRQFCGQFGPASFGHCQQDETRTLEK